MLLLARDPVGTRTLFYCLDEERCIWSSDLNTLVDLAGVDLRVNDEYVADYLAYVPEPSSTPYKDIHAVPPSCFLLMRPGKTHLERFWGLNPNSQIHYKTDEEYEQHFSQVFREAVRRRLRVDGTVWAELSGGLDSSSIVGIADQIIENGDAQATRLDTVSLVYDGSPNADERKFICHVEQQRGRIGHHLREEDYPILSPLADESSIVSPNPLHCFSEYHRGLSLAMSKAGVRVVLSGQGGDEMLCSGADPSPELADLFVLHKLNELHHRLQIWSQVLKRPYLKLLWQSAILPSCPPKIQTIFRHGAFRKIPPWYTKTFVARMNLPARMKITSDIFGFRSPSGRAQATGFLSVVKNVSTGHRQQLGNIEICYPYTDRSLVEFLQAIPFEQMVRPGETRSLMRRALKDVLPERVLKRKGKGDPTEAFFRAIVREAPRLKLLLKNAPRVSEYGYVDSNIMLAALEKARHGFEANTVALAKTISLELWLRALEKRRAKPISAVVSEGNVSRMPVMEIATVEP
jgi:asparagine synthase (glutamine-hydrolysing)